MSLANLDAAVRSVWAEVSAEAKAVIVGEQVQMPGEPLPTLWHSAVDAREGGGAAFAVVRWRAVSPPRAEGGITPYQLDDGTTAECIEQSTDCRLTAEIHQPGVSDIERAAAVAIYDHIAPLLRFRRAEPPATVGADFDPDLEFQLPYTPVFLDDSGYTVLHLELDFIVRDAALVERRYS